MVVFDEQVSEARIKAYYEALSPDFTDEQFDKAVNLALKNSFKFPPIAAFYKGDACAEDEGEKQIAYLKSLGCI